MNLVCIKDGGTLEDKNDALVCERCGQVYGLIDGAVMFRQGDDIPLLAEMLSLMQTKSVFDAARAFSREHQCLPARKKTGWNLFLPIPENGTVLEIGAGFGEDTAAAAVRAKRIVALVPHLANAGIVQKHLEEKGRDNVDVVVLDDLIRLPLADQSVDTITLEHAAASGFSITPQNFPQVAAEWKRVLRPGGSVLLGMKNTLEGKLGIAKIRSVLQAKQETDILNRVLKRSAGKKGKGMPGLSKVVRMMKEAGFEPPSIHAPFPNDIQADVIVPLDDPRAIRYFLHHLIRKNSPAMRAAIHAADVLVKLNLFRYVVPAYFLIFKRPA